MGQYHVAVNLDKKEYVHPHQLGLGLKQVEHTACVGSLSDALYALVTVSVGRGGGDLSDPRYGSDDRVLGRWVGDRVVILGDYTADGDIPKLTRARLEELMEGVWGEPSEEYKDISPLIRGLFGVNYDLEYSGKGWLNRAFKPGSFYAKDAS